MDNTRVSLCKDVQLAESLSEEKSFSIKYKNLSILFLNDELN